MSEIEIVSYQAWWPAEFAQIGAGLRDAFGPLALRIDHIGSTAVPDLAAKDIVDVQVTVAALQPDEALKAAVHAGGYRMLDHIVEDHRPPGDAGPDSDWQKRFCREAVGAPRRVHVHLRVAGAANQRYPLLFRDFLRANPMASGAYERIKCELARLHPNDVDAYYDIKDPACDVIIAAAEAWATATAWSPGPSDA